MRVCFAVVTGKTASIHSHPSMDDAVASGGLEPYSKALFDAVIAAAPGWLDRSVDSLLRARGADIDAAQRRRLEEVLRGTVDDIARGLSTLLAEDVDRQRSNPLHVLRQSTGAVTELLNEWNVAHVHRDEFDVSAMPNDVYGLGPFTWKDLSDEVHDAGITWGAWKAATVLQRRRAEGRA